MSKYLTWHSRKSPYEGGRRKLAVSLTTSEFAEVQRLAARQKKSMASVVRRAVKEILRQQDAQEIST